MDEIDQTADEITAWLRNYALDARAGGYVVGLSGGIDSAVTAALCQKAMGDGVLGVLMPCGSITEDAEMARQVAGAFKIRTVEVDLTETFESLLEVLPHPITDMARANIKPRLRMATLYALAQTHGYLVAGTGNRSELAIGYFTKYGDGGVDVEPLGGLYKWQVRLLARHLGVPQPIIERPPSAGLWAGQTDENEMGITYDELDSALTAIESGTTDDLQPALLQRVRRMVAATAHKRAMPPVCPLGKSPQA